MNRVTFLMRPIPAFRLDLTAWALRRRPENVVDRWDGLNYRRVVLLHSRPAEISVSQNGCREAPKVPVSVKRRRLGVHTKAEATALVTRTFGLQVDLDPFYRMGARDRKLRELRRDIEA
jgi:DNA-3-methyladenine glycosylase II